MNDPVEIDTNKYHHALAKYNLAVEHFENVVASDKAWNDIWFQELPSEIPEEGLKMLFKMMDERDDAGVGMYLRHLRDKDILEEAKRRAEEEV
jgi:hypothetical protein